MPSIFSKIEKALETDKKNNILNFAGLYLESRVKKPSQQGMVLKARNNIGKKFAVKYHHPIDTDPKILKDSMKRFIQEVRMSALLNHKNIVNVYSGGKAKWNDKDNQWQISEGFGKDTLEPKSEVLYYIMNFIEGQDISSIFPEVRKDNHNGQKSILIPIYERLKLFEEMICQVCNAINYYHTKGITHKDIKPDNIRFSSEDSTFIIVDFGFARYFDSKEDSPTIVRTEYLDLESILAKEYKLNDLGQFSRILLKILPSFKNEYDINRYQGIESVLEKAKNPDLKQRYQNAQEFENSIRQYFLTLPEWKFELKLNEFMCSTRFGRFSFKLRIPVYGSILLAEETRAIVDSPEFQRLRGIRQLGPTIFVFPGANHTRFEHSLGTYFLSLKYLEKLMVLPGFRELCEPVNETIKLIALSALLHDIGHYPYSHWIEELGDLPDDSKIIKHEDRAGGIICDGSIAKIIKKKWGVNPNDVSNIIATKHIGGGGILINSFINSVVDADNLDYLMRDSIHCGVNYGKGIDLERLLDSLYIEPDTKKICLTDKGRSCLLSILTCRNIMYQEVYWHKTVRACDAMFKRFFYEYIAREIDTPEHIQKYFEYSDDQFIAKLFSRSRDQKDLNKLISPFAFKGRSLYKPAYIFFATSTSKEPTDTRNFFRKILGITSYKGLVDLSDKLVDKLKRHVPGIGPMDIIIEKTPVRKYHEYYDLDGFKIWNLRKKVFEDYPHELEALNKYLMGNLQAYIFCEPRHYERLRELVLQEELDKILGEI